jgi:hypothetical protein
MTWCGQHCWQHWCSRLALQPLMCAPHAGAQPLHVAMQESMPLNRESRGS